jgi:hypothetical protein
LAFAKRKRKWLRILGGVLISLIIVGGLAFGSYIVFQNKMKTLAEDYQRQINGLEATINSQTKKVLIPNNSVAMGELLTEDLFSEVEITTSTLLEKYMSKEDFGAYALIDLEANVPVYKSMLTKDLISDDIREEEFNMFLLPSNMKINDYVDVRINFPNGEDYIVLSKKKVQNIDLKTNTVWLWLNEKEILTMSSAIIDAYLNKGTKLYSLTYVEPTLQSGSVETYPVNNDVLIILQETPNILDEARESMTAEARAYLEERLAYLSEDELSQVDVGINEEDALRNERIDEGEYLQEDLILETEGETIEQSEETNKGDGSDEQFFN